MKKLVVAVAIVGAAILANAGSVTWGLEGVTSPDSGMAYLFNSKDVTTATIDAIITSISDGTFASAYADNAAYSLEIEDGELFKTKAINAISGSTTLWIVGVDNESNPTMAFVGDAITQTIGSSGAKTYSWAYADNTTAWTAVGGGSVPEPTSGLLMLLGVAGLALRRKRA